VREREKVSNRGNAREGGREYIDTDMNLRGMKHMTPTLNKLLMK
jgi:hypothetical protein